MWLPHLLSFAFGSNLIASCLSYFFGATGMIDHPNGVCDVNLDKGLYEDPSGNPRLYLRCSPVGYGTLGIWKSESCLPGRSFRFREQRCKDMRPTASPISSNFIAILNGSCARGEECIGGTVCDVSTMRCLCPVGTVSNLETLSCNPVSSWFHSLIPKIQAEILQTDVAAENSVRPIAFTVEVPPGSSCANGEICTGGSLCTQPMMACLCPGDMEDIEGQCQEPQRPAVSVTAGIGTGCGGTVRCTNGSMCIDGQCECPGQLIRHGNQCTVKTSAVEVGPGELCDKNQVCSRGSVCHNIIPVCICPANTVLHGDSCLPAVPGTNNHVTNTWTSASAQSERAAMQNFAVSSKKFPVTPKLRISGTRQAGVGVPCQANTECMIGAFCKANTSPATCQCLSTHINVNGLCEKVIYPGRSGCRYDAQCSATYPGAKCSSGQCICPEGLSAIEQTCKSGLAYAGARCNATRGVDACHGRAVCMRSICRCPPALIEFQRQCIHPASLRRRIFKRTIRCRSSAECPLELICLSGRCSCTYEAQRGLCAGYILPSRKHLKKRKREVPHSMSLFEGRADSGGTKEANCTDFACSCPYGFAQSGMCANSRKGTHKPVHSHCEDEDRCDGGSVCQNSTCVCTAGSREQFGHCRQRPGGRCADGQLCSGGSSCYLGFCRCPAGRRFSKTLEICLPVLAKPGGTCHTGEQCLGGSLCRFGVCMCAVGYEIKAEQCVKVPGTEEFANTKSTKSDARRGPYLEDKDKEKQPGVELSNRDTKLLRQVKNAVPGQVCDQSVQCIRGSVCITDICTCIPGTRLVAGQCLIVEVQKTDDENRRFKASATTSNIQDVQSYRVKALRPSQNWTQEYPEISLCYDNAQCSLWTQCKRRVCRCKTNETNTGYFCKPVLHVALPGQQCGGLRECVGESRCLHGICVCTGGLVSTGLECGLLPEQTVQNEAVPKQVRINEACLNGQVCSGGAICIHGFCSCNSNEFINENGNCQSLYESDGNIGTWKQHLLALSIGITENPKPNYGAISSADSSMHEQQTALDMKFRPFATSEATVRGPNFKNRNSESTSVRKNSGLPGEGCTSSGICWNGAHCFRNLVCVCDLGYIVIGEFCKLLMVSVGEFCNVNEQCPVNSYCANSVCRCSDGFVEQSGICQKISVLGTDEEYIEKHRCGQNSIYVPGTGLCPCPRGQLLLDGICRADPSAKYALNCNNDEDCHHLAYCSNGYCVCLDASTTVAVYCVPQHEIVLENGEEDEITSREISFPRHKAALLLGSTTLGNKFATWPHRRNASEISRKIQKISRLNAGSSSKVLKVFESTVNSSPSNLSSPKFCTQSHECPLHSYCFQKNCVCKIGFLAIKNSCRALRAPYARCDSDDICASNSYCADGYCQCLQDTKLTRGRCIPKKYIAKLGQSCAHNFSDSVDLLKLRLPVRICADGMSCIDGWCVCEHGTVPNPQFGRCVSKLLSFSERIYRFRRRLKYAVSECRNLTDCIDEKQCYAGKCTLLKERTVQSPPGGSCTIDGDCSGGSTCQDGWCICPEASMSVIDGICIKLTPLTNKENYITAVQNNWQATNAVAFDAKIIAAQSNPKSPAKILSSALKMPGSPCGPLDRCSGESSCIEGLCLCPVGRRPSVATSRCEPKAVKHTTPKKESELWAKTKVTGGPATRAPEHECENDTQCSSDRICIVYRCKCKSGFIERNGTCVQVHETSPAATAPAMASAFQIPNSSDPNSPILLIRRPEQIAHSVYSATADNILTVTATTTTATVSHHQSGRPRITGPPLRRTRPQASTRPAYKTRPGNGVCPSGNQVVRDKDTNYLVICNGEKPLCPPKSYCYVTAFRSLKVARYGEACNNTNHVCLQNSACINGLCSCPEGRQLDAFGVCSTDSEFNKRILDLEIQHDSPGQEMFTSAQHPLVKAYSPPAGSCADGEICLGGSICDNDVKKCICAAGHRVDRGSCISQDSLQISQIGEKCTDDRECAGGAACIRGVCACKAKQYQSEANMCRYGSYVHLYNNATLRFSSHRQERKRNAATECPLPKHPELCRLPDCFCSVNGDLPPGGLSLEETPQFVVLTFDDAVNGKTVPDYRELFEISDFRNPNGCPIRATVFISHEWTNYDAVERLYQKGFEIASNSITHEVLTNESSERWFDEMSGQRYILARFGNVPEEEIRGMRAPQIAAGSDEQFEMMKESYFLYDNTLIADPGPKGEPYWPQTLDYRISWPCSDENCPQSSFPGVWEIPINMFYGSENNDSVKRSSMLRGAVSLNSSSSYIYKVLIDNFERSYYTDRAPYVLTLNADFLQLNNCKTAMNALKSFLSVVLLQKDVYVVSIKQLIEWMQNPRPIFHISESDAVQCDASNENGEGEICDKPNRCMYRTSELASPEHQFLTCSSCSAIYPWLKNPSGSVQRSDGNNSKIY